MRGMLYRGMTVPAMRNREATLQHKVLLPAAVRMGETPMPH
jgi:hypothetical protein